MGKISDYTRVLAAKLADVFVVDQTDNGTTETKSATVEQIGTAIGTLQNFASLDTSNKTLVDSINEIASYTPVYGNTASGAIANFDTSLALPLQDCTIAINAVQESGTPTPSSPKAISGFTGANVFVKGSNLFDEQTESGAYSSTNGTKTANNTTIRSVNAIRVIPNATYYIKAPDSLYIYQYKANGDYISYAGTFNNTTYTAPADCAYIRIGFRAQYGTTYNNDVSVNYPATDTAYHAYNANSHTTAITWQDEAGTVYGGSLDVTSGVLTVTWYGMALNTCTPIYNSTNLFFGYYNSSSTPSAVFPKRHKLLGGAKCECYAFDPDPISSITQIPSKPDKTIYCTTTGNLYIKDTDYTDTTSFLNAVGSYYLIYEMETPEVYQLTPTQISAIVGTNNIFTDTNGDTSVVYACSLKDYIDGQ